MGFGLLFIGYLLSHGFTSGANYVVSLVGIVGAVIMLLACRKLSLYSASFRCAGISSAALALAYLFNGALNLISVYANGVSLPGVLMNFARGVVIALVFVFNFYMYTGIADIARIAEVNKLAVSAVRNLVFMIIYYLVLVCSMVIRPYFPKVSGALGLAGAIVGVVWLVLSVWLVMSAYMRICLEGDEEMTGSPRKK